MTHEEIQDLLEAYVDDALDRPMRKMVDAHLAGCIECRAILDDVPEIDLSGLTGGSVDERMLKRSVRRAMRRTILDAAFVLIAAWILVWFIAAALIQPLVVNRTGRAASGARATVESAIMFNPGLTITDITIDSSWLSRLVTAEASLQVGSAAQPVGQVASRIGLVGFGDESRGAFFPHLDSSTSNTVDSPGLARLGDATVATIQVQFDEPISVVEAQSLADSTANDIRVIWAGFPTSSLPFDGGPFGLLGYGTCGVSLPDDSFFGASSASSGGSTPNSLSSIHDALDHVRRALANLEASPAASTMVGIAGADQLRSARGFLASDDPGVLTLVATGPSTELVGFLNEAGVAQATLLGVSFYNWSNPICGR